jgi:hypothetical protein
MTEAEEGRGVRPYRRVALHDRNGAPRLCDGLYAHPNMRAGGQLIPTLDGGQRPRIIVGPHSA